MTDEDIFVKAHALGDPIHERMLATDRRLKGKRNGWIVVLIVLVALFAAATVFVYWSGGRAFSEGLSSASENILLFRITPIPAGGVIGELIWFILLAILCPFLVYLFAFPVRKKVLGGIHERRVAAQGACEDELRQALTPLAEEDFEKMEWYRETGLPLLDSGFTPVFHLFDDKADSWELVHYDRETNDRIFKTLYAELQRDPKNPDRIARLFNILAAHRIAFVYRTFEEFGKLPGDVRKRARLYLPAVGGFAGEMGVDIVVVSKVGLIVIECTNLYLNPHVFSYDAGKNCFAMSEQIGSSMFTMTDPSRKNRGNIEALRSYLADKTPFLDGEDFYNVCVLPDSRQLKREYDLWVHDNTAHLGLDEVVARTEALIASKKEKYTDEQVGAIYDALEPCKGIGSERMVRHLYLNFMADPQDNVMGKRFVMEYGASHFQ